MTKSRLTDRALRRPLPGWIIEDGWINEDELPKGYPYDEMWPHSKLGQDGLGGVRIFPRVRRPLPREKRTFHEL